MKHFPLFLVGAALLGLALLQTGCEVDSATENNVSISPSSARLDVGESATFTASGGFDYEWSLADGKETWGTLSTRRGPTTTYTSRHTPATNAQDDVQVLTVTSFIQGQSSVSGTNGTAYAQTAEAFIYHEAPEGEDDGGTAGAVSISPSDEINLAEGQSQIYTASGGDGVNYTWSISDSSLGWLSTTKGPSTRYTSTYTDTGAGQKTQFLTVSSGGFDLRVSVRQE